MVKGMDGFAFQKKKRSLWFLSILYLIPDFVRKDKCTNEATGLDLGDSCTVSMDLARSLWELDFGSHNGNKSLVVLETGSRVALFCWEN